ncbi:hypothetical protein ABIE91_006824 [Bradyrhizobium elkanii]
MLHHRHPEEAATRPSRRIDGHRSGRASFETRNALLRMTGIEGCFPYASIPRCTKIRSPLSFQTSILTICPPRTTKRST